MPELALDWIIGVVMLLSLFVGAWRGLVYEVLSLLNWVAAFILAQWLASDLAVRLPMSGASEIVRYSAAFLVVFVVAVFVGGLCASLVRKAFAAAGLQAIDRILGAVFGFFRGFLALLAVTVVVSMTQWRDSPWWEDSVGAGIAQVALKGLKPMLPQEVGKYLP